MDKSVVSDQLTRLIGGQPVIAGVFTTYTFEPDFFELDIIPLILKPGNPFSTDERVKTFQVREALRESGLELEVFFDLPIFRQAAERSPAMEYRCHGVQNSNSAFHAKSIYLLLGETDSRPQRLLVAAGSNNLTRAGWWENIEVQHWEEVLSGEAQRAFLNRLKEDIAWLTGKRGIGTDSALEKIGRFLNDCGAARDAEPVFYYGPSNRRDLFSFLRSVRGESLDNYQNWTLEIISPFFADDPKNTLHEQFFEKFGVQKILLLLPMDQDGTALCPEEYFDHIGLATNIAWARWNPRVGKALGMTDELFRRVHAKIYHFYNGRQAWAFIGSVNFSHKAFHDNIEAGFLVRLDEIEPLLEPIPKDVEIDRFEPPTDESSAKEGDIDTVPLPELHLSYDWVTKRLTGRTAEGKQYDIELKNAERQPALGPWRVRHEESRYEHSTVQLEEALRQGSLVSVCGKDADTEEAFAEHQILLQQTGWTHKPIDLPGLSPEQILEIYAGMSEERRQLMLMNAQVKSLVLRNMGGEMTIDTTDTGPHQFFCEYAEIFHAFRNLKQRLLTSLEKEALAQVDYYLTGSGMDSLPSLLKRVSEQKEEDFSGVTAYLLMLSARELLSDKRFADRPNVSEYQRTLIKKITSLKNDGTIRLEETSPEQREEFFTWFEKQFFMKYVTAQPEDEEIDEAS